LAAARATIARLEAEIANQGLRQRKQAAQQAADAKDRAAQGAVATATQQPHTEGIPVQITAALCLMAFLIAWWFF
jgi:hypothetical protein